METITPLEGVRVLDFGQVWAGPLLGAGLAIEVIQITSMARAAVQTSAGSGMVVPEILACNSINRSRLGIALDPTNPTGRELFHRLVAVSDIVFDNFSPRAAAKLSLDYDELSRVNPRIIVASLSAAGRTGPWSDLLTYGPSLTALYGIKSLLGYAGESEVQEDVADLDPTAATYAFIAILAALRHRERTGEGQFIDMAQGEAGLATLAEAFLELSFNGRVMGPTGNGHRTMAPHGIYPADGDDRWISIAVDSEAAWHACCRVLGDPSLATDSGFSTTYRRLRNVKALDRRMAPLTSAHDATVLTERLQAEGVAAYPVLDAFGVIGNDQLAFRRESYRTAMPHIGPREIVAPTPWRMALSPPTVYGPSRTVGADNDRVFGQLLGMSEAERAAAESRGAFG